MIVALVFLEETAEKTPLMAFDAVVLACKLGVPAPPWVAEVLERINADRVAGKIASLDRAFGFSSSRGKTSEVRNRLLAERDEMLLLDVWRLILLGKSVDSACLAVSERLRRTRGWNETDYDIDFGTDSEATAETLRKKFFAFKRQMRNASTDSAAWFEGKLRAYAEAHKDKIIAMFYPPA